MVLSFYQGPLAQFLGGVDIAFAVALAVAGVSYLILSRTQPQVPEPANQDVHQVLTALPPEQRPKDIAVVDDPLAASTTPQPVPTMARGVASSLGGKLV